MKEKSADEKRIIKQLTRAEINKLDMIKLREKYNELYKEYLKLINEIPCKSLEKLGFKTHKRYEELVFYKNARQWRKDGELQITFNLGMKNIDIAFTKSQGEPVFLELEEIQAIFAKCQELGWLDD